MGIGDFFKKVDGDKLAEALAADDPAAVKAVAQEAGVEISDEQLDYIAGGYWDEDLSTWIGED